MGVSPTFRIKLEAALQRRSALLSTEALRLFDGSGDGIPGLLIDRIGAAVIVRVHEDSEAESNFSPDTAASILKGMPGVQLAVLWTHTGDPADTTRQGAKLLFGAEVEEVIFAENGVRYVARPMATPSAGFFIDMRDVRATLKSKSQGKRILNTFCFTGSLGLAALIGGACEVVQVDISKSALTWARKNRELNAESGAGKMRFIPEDTLTFLEREVRRRERRALGYDIVIVDPPAFGSSKGKRFVQEDEVSALASASIALLHTDGSLLLTSNRSTVTPGTLESIVREAATARGLKIRSVSVVLPPRTDFTAQGVDSNAMRGVWVHF